tara:strand:+ start:672 stop:1340 length:669 start_codon:yes stop_codon:yes gene_type:complete
MVPIPIYIILLLHVIKINSQGYSDYVEPVHRYNVKITGKLNKSTETMPPKKINRYPINNSPDPSLDPSHPSKKRELYTNDGHHSGTPSGELSKYSWEHLDKGVFPQRNEDYPEPVFSQNLPSIQKPPARVDKPAISAEMPSLEWLVSGDDWVENNYFYSSNVEYGRRSYVVDKDLGSQVHLSFDPSKPCFLVFNLRKGTRMEHCSFDFYDFSLLQTCFISNG